jgi:hypothetical protein
MKYHPRIRDWKFNIIVIAIVIAGYWLIELFYTLKEFLWADF